MEGQPREFIEFEPSPSDSGDIGGDSESSHEREWADRVAESTQAYEVVEDGVVLRSRYYFGGKIFMPFHNISNGGVFYKRLRDAGRPKGGVGWQE